MEVGVGVGVGVGVEVLGAGVGVGVEILGAGVGVLGVGVEEGEGEGEGEGEVFFVETSSIFFFLVILKLPPFPKVLKFVISKSGLLGGGEGGEEKRE